MSFLNVVIYVESHLFGVKILGSISGYMFGKTVNLESLSDSFEDNLLERTRSVLAKLARMGVVTMRH